MMKTICFIALGVCILACLVTLGMQPDQGRKRRRTVIFIVALATVFILYVLQTKAPSKTHEVTTNRVEEHMTISLVGSMDADTLSEYLSSCYTSSFYTQGATSELTSSKTGYTYRVDNMVDGDISTCWQEGVAGFGEGEGFGLSVNDNPRYLVIWNGNQRKGEETYYKNGRVCELVFRFSNGDETTITLPDTTDPVVFETNFPNGYGDLIVRIVSVYTDGAEFEDTCISEIGFYSY